MHFDQLTLFLVNCLIDQNHSAILRWARQKGPRVNRLLNMQFCTNMLHIEFHAM